jgi:hypothetical protein
MHEPFGVAMAVQAGTFFHHAGVFWAFFQTLETSELFRDCMTFSDLYGGHRTADVLCWFLWIVQTDVYTSVTAEEETTGYGKLLQLVEMFMMYN